MKISRNAVLLITIILGCSLPHPAASESNLTQRPEFLLGGQIPFWIIAGESGTASDTPQANAARPALQRRAMEMFDIVIPSSIHWNWVEEQSGVLDFHRYNWANNWATEHGKTTLVQHILWEWPDTKPLWARELSDEEFRTAIFKHIQDVKDQIGDVPRIVVINEMTCKTYLEDRMGPGITREILDQARKVFPHTELFLNEHGCPDPVNPGKTNLIQEALDNYADLVLKLESLGANFDRVGFQSYFSESDVIAQGGIESFVERYSKAVDRFSKVTNYNIIITELGFDASDEDFKAKFLRAFFEMTLANAHIEGLIIFHWLDAQAPGTALVNLDGSLTKAGQVFYEVFSR